MVSKENLWGNLVPSDVGLLGSLWIDLSPDEIVFGDARSSPSTSPTGSRAREVGVRLYSQGERLRWKTSARRSLQPPTGATPLRAL